MLHRWWLPARRLPPGRGLATTAPAAERPPICELEAPEHMDELEHDQHDQADVQSTPAAQVRPLTVEHDAPQNDTDVGASFINALKLPLHESLLQAPPRPRARRTESANLIPRCSDRLAAKSAFHDPNPEKQAKRMLVNKWDGRPDDAVTNSQTLQMMELL